MLIITDDSMAFTPRVASRGGEVMQPKPSRFSLRCTSDKAAKYLGTVLVVDFGPQTHSLIDLSLAV